jgi:membrane protein YqaA with SNARE-associated domain
MVYFLEIGYFGLFLGTLLAATIIPFSSEFILTAMLFAGFDPLVCFVVATIGNTLGSYITYFMGRLLDYEKALKKLNFKEERIEQSKNFISKYGIWSALFSWVPIFGDIATFLLGTYHTKILHTFSLILIGKAGRFAIFILIFVYSTT